MEKSAIADRIKLPFRFDALAMQRDLEVVAGLSFDWTDHFVRQNYEGSWSVIPLRANKGSTHPIKMIYSDPTCKDFVDTPFLEACKAFPAVFINV